MQYKVYCVIILLFNSTAITQYQFWQITFIHVLSNRNPFKVLSFSDVALLWHNLASLIFITNVNSGPEPNPPSLVYRGYMYPTPPWPWVSARIRETGTPLLCTVSQWLSKRFITVYSKIVTLLPRNFYLITVPQGDTCSAELLYCRSYTYNTKALLNKSSDLGEHSAEHASVVLATKQLLFDHRNGCRGDRRDDWSDNTRSFHQKVQDGRIMW